MKFNNILKSYTIKNQTIKNRLTFPAIYTGLASNEGKVTSELLSFYENIAQSGVGLIITEPVKVDDETGISHKNELSAVGLNYCESLKMLSDIIHKQDCKVLLQLNHPGILGNKSLLDEDKIVGPSVLKLNGIKPTQLTLRGIQVLINRFSIAAKVAEEAGMDGIELEAGNGQLIQQFLSSNTNLREDKYGGNIFNNFNFLKDILNGIRQFCSPSFLISIKCNIDDFFDNNITLSDLELFLTILKSLGPDILNVSTKKHNLLEAEYNIKASNTIWYKKDFIESLSNVKIPIITDFFSNSLENMDKFIKNQNLDFITTRNPIIADYNFIHHSLNNKTFNKCMQCMDCLKNSVKSNTITCKANKILY